ncbi:hypothetical protein PSH97_21715 [Pseudomonas cucumis]|uniref:Uncharacterized protein n=1 Tax=Pseudomonas cucumis TaxID=2954082 RepID=A0ABY9ETD2_9PSED|nr:hypothetical protein [Pseudomonas cucumis]WLG83694.1 hypothetical protein PSH97_21715 [Pseudomonas cucumis]
MEQSEWEVMLASGEPEYLRHLSRHGYSNGYFRIWGGLDYQNDCESDHFSFNSIYFEGDDVDEEIVWQVSYELLCLLNGAVELFYFDHREWRIDRILRAGIPIQRVEKKIPRALLGAPNFPPHRRNERFLNRRVLNSITLIQLATENQDVHMILKYLALKGGWANYYKLMETIDSHASIKNIDVPDDRAKRTTFKNTANNFSLAGYDSRHGFKQLVKQNNTPAMTLQEGYSYVISLAKNYLVRAYDLSTDA